MRNLTAVKISLARPDITNLERQYVSEILGTSSLSLGPKLQEFEKKLAKYVGCRYAVAVNSGTSALHLAVKALRIGERDEVVTTPFSFIASANCILFERAKPVFVDIDDKTLNIDINKLEDKIKKLKFKSQNLKAILPVHVFGRPCEMDEILEIAEKYELKVIEDACEAIGAEYLTENAHRETQNAKRRSQSPILSSQSSRLMQVGSKELVVKSINAQDANLKSKNLKLKGSKEAEVNSKRTTGNSYNYNKKMNKIWQKVGTFGECSVFAFYPNKQITTGEGGMLVTDDENIYKLCKSMRNQGRSDNCEWLQHERLGYNYRISDINCALGLAQLKRIDEILAKREKVAKLYNEKLAEIDELILPQSERNKKISWFVYVVRLIDKFSRKDRDLILGKLKEKGIGCSNYFVPIHLQPFYQKMFGYKTGDFPATERVAKRTIALPFYNNLKEEEINFVCNCLKEVLPSKKVSVQISLQFAHGSRARRFHLNDKTVERKFELQGPKKL